MAIPVYLWLQDDSGVDIKGDVNVSDRNGSIEVLELMHVIEIPTDSSSGAITGTRIHGGYSFEKEVDSSSPYLYDALSTGKKLRKGMFSFYKINDGGREQEYFRTTLEGVTVNEITPFMLDVKDSIFHKHTHHEYVTLRYEKITWHYIDGNVIHSDSWNVRGAV